MNSYLIKSWMVICVFVWLSKDSSADVCSRAETWFQSTFPGTKEFSTDGISQDCYSSHLSCTESFLKRKYGSNMTWDKLDAPPAEKFTLTARCENGNVIDVGWKLPQFRHADDGHAVFCNTPQNSWLVRNADHRRGIVHRGRHHSHPTKISQTDEEIASCSRGMKYGSENFRVRVYSDTGKIDVDSLAGNFTRFSRAKRVCIK
ncbi:uncharacterized protein LOC128230810 [Mya arenaria]|uniref:uncharacterized protein LOC128230810 n=1 Tax=Mya arenaria TaxID=6604 RepID=UPI0022E6BCF8|nr:uncharacterized protein LOC128230810 [Mya arenaria]